jgi:hypothetical protein
MKGKERTNFQQEPSVAVSLDGFSRLCIVLTKPAACQMSANKCNK